MTNYGQPFCSREVRSRTPESESGITGGIVGLQGARASGHRQYRTGRAHARLRFRRRALDGRHLAGDGRPERTGLQPGDTEQGHLALKITPSAKKGKTVRGTLYVDEFNSVLDVGGELVAIPYEYTVG
jgi:hypothetical protein